MPSLSHVLGPTTPSAVRPWARWKDFTAASVLGPKAPSAAPTLWPSALRRFCRAVTAAPLAPSRSTGPEPPEDAPTLLRALHVLGPTTPSAVRPRAFWKAFTAALVLGPKAPSTVPGLKPAALSLFCSVVTEAPLAPSRSTGLEAAAVVRRAAEGAAREMATMGAYSLFAGGPTAPIFVRGEKKFPPPSCFPGCVFRDVCKRG